MTAMASAEKQGQKPANGSKSIEASSGSKSSASSSTNGDAKGGVPKLSIEVRFLCLYQSN